MTYIFKFNERVNNIYNLLKKTNILLSNFLRSKNEEKEEIIELLNNLELLLNSLNDELELIKKLFEEISIYGYKFKDKNLFLLFYNYYFLFKERNFFITKEEVLLEYLEKLKEHIKKLKDLVYSLLDRINDKKLVESILRKHYSIFSKEQSHVEYVINKTNYLIDNYYKIKINRLSFTDLSIKKIKKYKDINHLKIILLRLENLIREGLNSNRLRLFNEGLAKELDLIDYPDEHTRERFALKPIYKNGNLDEIIVYDVFLDHLGKDKKDYENYWKGNIKETHTLRYLVLDKELLAFLLTKDSNLLKLLLKIIKE